MESTLITEIAEKVPGLIVLSWIVWRFLTHIRESESERKAVDQARVEAIKALITESHTFQTQMMTRSDDALTRITQALERNAERTGQLLATLKPEDRHRA